MAALPQVQNEENLRNLQDMTTRSLHLRADSIDEENRTVEAVISSENPVLVFDWGRFEPVYEILLSAGRDSNVNQVPMLDSHQRNGISSILGSIRGIKNSQSEVIGRLFFAENNEKADEAWNLVRQKHLTDVSAGYRVLKYTDIDPGQEAVIGERTYKNDFDRVLRVTTKWKLKEGSLVAIGADEASKIKRELENLNSRSSKIMDESKTKNQTEEKVEVVSTPPPAPVDTAKIERETRETELRRIQEIDAIGEKFNLKNEAQRAIKEGKSVDSFRDDVLKTLEKAQHIDTKAVELDIPEKEKKRYSLSNALIAMVTNDPTRAPFEYEISRELEKKLNKKPQGLFIPHEVLVGRTYTEIALKDQERVLTAASGAANLVGTDHLAGSFIEMLRNRIVVQQLGTLTLTGLSESLSIPKQSGAGTAAWLATEATSVTAADQTFTAVTLSPKNVAADTQISRQAILQANPSIESLVMNDLIAVLARAIDLGAIDGSGASGQPLGILNTSGIGAVAGTTLDWSAIVEFETDVAAANADLGSMYYLTNATVRGLCKTRVKDTGSGLFLMENDSMNGYPVAVSNQVPASTMIFGSFNQLIMGFWGVLDLMVNPYLYAATRYVAIHSTQTVDVAVRHAAAFSASEDIT